MAAEFDDPIDSLTKLIQVAPIALLLVDQEGKIEWVNLKSEQLFGYNSAELVGQSIEILIPKAFHTEHASHLKSFFSSSVSRAMANRRRLYGCHKNGSVVPVEIGLNIFKHKQVNKVVAAISPMAEQFQAEADRKRLSEIIERSASFVGSCDIDGNLKYHNPAAYSILGLDPGIDISTMSVEDVLTPEAFTMLKEDVFPTVFANGVWKGESELVHASGATIPVSSVVVLHKDFDGNPEYLSTIMHDISEQKRREQQLSDAMQAAEQANKAKSSFVANMSHEIRTPLNAVLGSLELLQCTGLSDRQSQYVRQAALSARVLLNILNDILDFSKIEAGKILIDKCATDIYSFMSEFGVLTTAQVANKNIELLFDIDSRIPFRVLLDPLRLQQILLNLIGNAIKFTDQGDVVLTLDLLEDAAHECTLRFTVEDSGIGISKEQWHNIFERFTQAESSTSRRYGGTGLGLTICTRLLQLLGSKLEGESTEGVGTRFWFDLNVDKIANDDFRPSAELCDLTLDVFVVIESSRARQIFAKVLDFFGWQCHLFANKREAIANLKSGVGRRPDLILVDWKNTNELKIDLLKEIRQFLKGCNTKIILLLNDTELTRLEALYQAEVKLYDGALLKPVIAPQLAKVIAELLNQERYIENDRSDISGASNTSRSSLEGFRVLIVEDIEINRMIAEQLLASQGAVVSVAHDGIKAVEMLKTSHQSFDAVLMDIQMPGMDGYQTTQEIRKIPGLATLPIIAVTANALSEDRSRAIESGMNDHVGKPYRLQELIDCIRRWAKR